MKFALSKKAKISEVQIREIIQEIYDGCVVIQLDRNIILRASELRTQYSFWFFVTWYGSIGWHKSTKSLSGKSSID